MSRGTGSMARGARLAGQFVYGDAGATLVHWEREYL